MRKIIQYYIAVASLLALVVACGPSAAEKEAARVRRSKTPNPITWDTLFIKNSQPLDAKVVKASCSIEMDYIVPKEYSNQEVLQKIQAELNTVVMGDDNGFNGIPAEEAIKKYSESYITNYEKEAKSQLPLWNKINGGNGYFSYDKKIETNVLYSEANLISYQVKTTETKGDSTSTVVVRNVLLDLATGNILAEKDIFEGDFKEKLNKIIIDQIIKDNKVENIEELQALGYWGVADLAANNNFYVDKDGITYTFGPDEYSDAELGVLNVFINYDDMMDIFLQESPISLLIHDLD